MNVDSAINNKNKSSKVVVVQPFNAACLACQRRKVKCIGNPCLYCCKKGYNCEFKASKKRGPTKKVKLPQEIHECSSVVSSIQESMNITLQHANFVEHYFITVGKAIPMSVKESLLSSPNLNAEQITQVCIITANIMKAYGSKELELQYIKKAHETISIFSCDNINSAASLVMMANYLGGDNPKSMNLIQIAQSIANLPSMDGSQLTNEIKHVCEILSVMFSTTLSRFQKANFLIQLSYQITPNIALNIPQEGLVVVSSIICRHLLYSIARFDDYDLDTFLQSMALGYIMSPIEKERIQKEMARFEHCFELQPVKKPIAVTNFDFMRFTIEWRSGNIDAAFVIAKRVMDYMKSSMVAMTFLNESGSLHVLLLPYFFEENGYTELTLEVMQCYYSQFKQVGREDELRELWDKMRPSTGFINGHGINLLPTVPISQYMLHDTIPENNSTYSTLNPDYQLTTHELLTPIPQPSQPFISSTFLMPEQLSTLPTSTITPEQQYISSSIMPDQHFTNISQDIPLQDLDILHFSLDSYTNPFPF